ncbi:MAG TPA: formyltransferase family protein [Patescibacteria group bacterium]
MKESELRTVHLISGRGSTVLRIVNESVCGELVGKVKPVLVITNNQNSEAISLIRAMGVRCETVRRNKRSREEFGDEIIKLIREVGGDILFQNGWLAYTPENVVNEFPGMIFNQHPGPLDSHNRDNAGNLLHFGGEGMYGIRVHAAVLKFQELAQRNFPTEATIHIVTPEFDGGEVVARSEVEVCHGDTPEELAGRVLPVEHETHIVFLSQLHEGKVEIKNRKIPLIKKGEENLLYQSKKHAINTYP